MQKERPAPISLLTQEGGWACGGRVGSRDIQPLWSLLAERHPCTLTEHISYRMSIALGRALVIHISFFKVRQKKNPYGRQSSGR